MIGVDCGGRKLAIVDVDAMFFHTYEVRQLSERGQELRAAAEHLLGLGLSGPVWVEAPLVAGARNLQSSLKVAQMTGVVHACLPETHQVAVSSWKQRVVGRGNADKGAVRSWLDEHHPDIAHLCRGNQDLYDAACIALYGRDVAETVAASGLSPL